MPFPLFPVFYHHTRCCHEYTAQTRNNSCFHQLGLRTLSPGTHEHFPVRRVYTSRAQRVLFTQMEPTGAALHFPRFLLTISTLLKTGLFSSSARPTSWGLSALSSHSRPPFHLTPTPSHFQFHFLKVLKSPHPKEKRICYSLLSLPCCFPSIYYTT